MCVLNFNFGKISSNYRFLSTFFLCFLIWFLFKDCNNFMFPLLCLNLIILIFFSNIPTIFLLVFPPCFKFSIYLEVSSVIFTYSCVLHNLIILGQFSQTLYLTHSLSVGKIFCNLISFLYNNFV